MTASQGIIDRIRKLLNVADDPNATDGEIANATAAAAALMERYNVDRAALNDGDKPKTADDFTVGRRCVALTSKMYAWESMLGPVVCRVVGLVACYGGYVAGEGRLRAMWFYGDEESADAAADLFARLRNVIIERATEQFGGCYKGDGGEYAEGFVVGVASQMRRKDPGPAATDVRAITVVQRDQLAAIGKAIVERAKDHFALQLGGAVRRQGASGSGAGFVLGRMDGSRQPLDVRRRGAKMIGGGA